MATDLEVAMHKLLPPQLTCNFVASDTTVKTGIPCCAIAYTIVFVFGSLANSSHSIAIGYALTFNMTVLVQMQYGIALLYCSCCMQTQCHNTSRHITNTCSMGQQI